MEEDNLKKFCLYNHCLNVSYFICDCMQNTIIQKKKKKIQQHHQLYHLNIVSNALLHDCTGHVGYDGLRESYSKIAKIENQIPQEVSEFHSLEWISF